MIYGTHVLLAIFSVAFATYTYAVPSYNKLFVTGLLTIGTGITGVLMGFQDFQTLEHLGNAGLLYILFMSTMTYITLRRLVYKS